MIRDLAKQMLSSLGLPWLTGLLWYRRILAAKHLPESSAKLLDGKVEVLRDLANRNAFGRAVVWRELARLERLRGRPALAAIFALRTIRLLDRDDDGALPWILEALQAAGFAHEAAAAAALYGDPQPERSFAACRELLEQARLKHRLAPEPDYSLLDDRREDRPFRVAVVVSMYNAAPKLRLFLDSLLDQSLVRRREVEFVLVDSASPTDEYAIVRDHPLYADGCVVYARTTVRETIQLAWNRGVTLARAPHLAMLGADEGTTDPQSLEILVQELEADPQLDWVQANALQTEVDEDGRPIRDVLTYDRSGYSHGLEYIDPWYLSYVGAMLRKSVHERHGYYDATFRGGGDTEFKNRVLPYIRTKVVPRTLGLFRLYPDPRLTDSPRTELESIRSWHLHRSPAGIDYAWSGRSTDEALRLARLALRYRKSAEHRFCGDIDYAAPLFKWLCAHGADPTLYRDASLLRDAFRTLDAPSESSSWASLSDVRRAFQLIARVASSPRTEPSELNSDLFRDDRFDSFKTIWTREP